MPELGLATSPAVPAMDQPLVEPEIRRSANGVLSTSLRCRLCLSRHRRHASLSAAYEGGLAPTLRMKPGETLKIRLINDLPPNRDPLPANPSFPHQYNNTNFHFHGAHCSPSGISDNVMRSMEPGKAYDIEITLPADHTRGTYWYHPHHHGAADVQMASGMAGAIIVEGDFADVPEIAAARERVMVLAQVVFDAFGMIEDFDTLFPETATRFLTVNGQRRPIIEMRPGEVQRWRLVCSPYQDDMLLELEKHRAERDRLRRHPARAACRRLEAAADRAGPARRRAGAGGRARAPTSSARMPYDQGHPSPVGPLARVVVAGEPLPMKLPAALPKPPLETIRDSEITGRRTLVFSATAPQSRCRRSLAGVQLPGRRQGLRSRRASTSACKLGAVEEWTIVNTHVHDDHVFHIHINPFQVDADRTASRWPTAVAGLRDRARARAAASRSARASSITPGSS